MVNTCTTNTRQKGADDDDEGVGEDVRSRSVTSNPSLKDTLASPLAMVVTVLIDAKCWA